MSRLVPKSETPLSTAKTRFNAGAPRSVRRLKELQFDPIGELVSIYEKLVEEIRRQEQIRDGTLVEKSASGHVRHYRPDTHQQMYDRLINIAEKLLRYGYGRVPEVAAPTAEKAPPLIVNLSKEGDVYTINDDPVPIQDVDYDEED